MTYRSIAIFLAVVPALLAAPPSSLGERVRYPVSRREVSTILRSLILFVFAIGGISGPANAAELKSDNNSSGVVALPFDVRNGAIADAITGPMIVNPRQQDELHPTNANAVLYDMSFLTFVRHHDQSSAEITIAAEPDTTGSDLFLFDKNGLLIKPAPASVDVDKATFDAFKASHRRANVDILADDPQGKSHHITMTFGGDLDLTVLNKITDHPECLTFPERVRVTWDDEAYDVVVIMPAIYNKYDGIINYYDQDCVYNKIQTKNSSFANLSLNDLPFPTSSNFYISSLHSIYVIPIYFFGKQSINNNKVVFGYDAFERSIARTYQNFSKSNANKSKCMSTALDCAQAILDGAMHALVQQRG
ncbi:hypothetical protein FHT86_007177 [Rhizobium sp. BK313]|uniref:hypothetical protein n=1 Tax=Rhizobium sp. BK313 TaxID=2587081 RepID=UPI00105E8F8D|nr:hypothetical protein [Rhizobium sp. BK313]MBB3458851.1 hypothetical protein [Rhizobium sp. BK313]